jgi:hypothetical protein
VLAPLLFAPDFDTSERMKPKHGMSRTAIYYRWNTMRQRCENPKRLYFEHYGGRGIAVCERWLKFENFYEDMGEPPTPDHQIDRIDNNGPYSPENCRWTTRFINSNNSRNIRYLTFNDKTQSLSAWARELGLRPDTLWRRLCKWPIHKAFQSKSCS